jgi:hypothetical protein
MSDKISVSNISESFQLFLDQFAKAVFNLIMAGYGSFLSILCILINVVLFTVTQKETPMIYKMANESMSLQVATSISFSLTSVRLRTGSVSSISS